MNWYLEAFQKYAVFSGRARRKEYWYFVLFNFLMSIALAFVDNVFGSLNLETGVGLLSGLYSLVVLIPSLSVLVRRLHDTGRSGWWVLIIFIPVLGALVLLVFTLQNSELTENQYGINPKMEV